MLSLRLRSILILFVGVGPWYAWPVAYGGEETDALRTRLFAEARKRTERCWERYIGLDPPHDDTSARAVMSYALILAQANAHLERLPRLMELTEHMQQDDPESPDHGNLWWYWRDGEVTDPNSVEFVMQTATRLWTRHRTELEPTVVSSLHRVMTLGAQGCMQHQVPVWYTNIAILNASNLIALGEILEDPAVAEEGYRRLKDICLWTWKYGITEYVSPTYYAVNLDGLRWIAARADRAEGRRQAESMLNLLATDIGASWWPPAQRVAGAHSRSYDYLHGTGELDKRIALAGWTNETVRVGVHHADTLGDDWSLPAAARQLASRFPRRVRQRWGEGLTQTRSAYLLPDIALSIASAYYGRQDVPLAVDLPGDPSTVRCYFIADGRDDPYGAKRYATGQAGHRKALHLPYFWAGAQRGPDALGLVVYREEDLNEPERTGLKSHFVFRRNHDGLFVGDRQVTFGDEGRRQAPVLPGETVVVRYAAAAVGIRVLFARRRDGWAASTAVVDDGNSHGALRLSVDHDAIHDQGEQAAACFWVRIGSGLADDAAFARWRREFTAAQPHVHVTHKVPMERAQNELRWLRHFAIRAPGVEGPVGIDFSESLAGMDRVTLDPSPTDAILEIDGQPVGRQILADLPFVRQYVEGAKTMPVLNLPVEGDFGFEAEEGLCFGGMEKGSDADASGGAFVGSNRASYQTARFGSVRWLLSAPEPGRYWLWGRILATDSETDSFYVQVHGSQGAIASQADWHAGAAPVWSWRRFDNHPSREPVPLDLPAGTVELILRVREPGARIDRLALTRDPNRSPEVKPPGSGEPQSRRAALTFVAIVAGQLEGCLYLPSAV